VRSRTRLIAFCCGVLPLLALFVLRPAAAQQQRRYLYVAVPGADKDVADHGALGVLVFDIDDQHKLVRRISPWPSPAGAEGEHVRGIAADVETRRLYLSTVGRLAAIDLATDRLVWENTYDGHCCDRLDVSPNGRIIYAPAFGRPKWYAIDARDGALITTIDVMGWPRQTIYSRDGQRAYLSAWESPMLSVVDTKTHKVIREVGPFSNFVCPFTIDGREALAYANVDGLVGFEVGDLRSGLLLDRVIVEDSDADAWPKYECPSHGIGLTPDERELWVADGVNNRLRIFDATIYPPVPTRNIDLRVQPRWLTFSIDGRYAYVSTGDVIAVAKKNIVGALENELGAPVRSEKLVEIDFAAGRPATAGRQVGIGGRR